MESHARLDASGGALVRKLILLFSLLLAAGMRSPAAFPQALNPALQQQTAPHSPDVKQNVKALYDAGRWNDVLQALPDADNQDADLQMYRGLSLAKLARWDEAQHAFEKGTRNFPRDARFRVELGGVAYRRGDRAAAKHELRRALDLAPQDEYANGFLASIYFLEGNLEAALKYWNRAGEPRLTDLSFAPPPRLNPLVLDRAERFAPGSVWTREQFLATRTQLEALELYPRLFFDLRERQNHTFDLTIRSSERHSWGSGELEGAVSLLRGLPYATVYPEFYNLSRAGVNWTSLVRWDDQRRRVSSEVAAPLFARPEIRYRVYFDGRNENWNTSRTLLPVTPAASAFNMQSARAGAEIRFLPSGRWNWNTGVEYSYRKFRDQQSIPAGAAPFFTSGSAIAVRAGAQRSMIRFPERRFALDSTVTGEVGGNFSRPLGRYARVQGSLAASWLPKATGDDYELSVTLSGGGTAGLVPIDKLFMLGFERDNDLELRGHPGLLNDQKGRAPMGRDFVLVNSEFDKIAYHNGLLTVRVGPILDTGRIYDPSPYFGTRNWLVDTGAQAKIRVLGSVEFVLGYGKDLRTGTNSFFTKVSR